MSLASILGARERAVLGSCRDTFYYREDFLGTTVAKNADEQAGGNYAWTDYAAGNGGSAAPLTHTDTGRYGIVRCTLVAAANSGGALAGGSANGPIHYNGFADVGFTCRLSVRLNQTTDQEVVIGMLGDVNVGYNVADVSHCVAIIHRTTEEGANFHGLIKDAGTAANETSLDLGVAADTDFHSFMIRRLTSSVEFWIDDVRRGEQTDLTNVDTANFALGTAFETIAGAANTYDVDYLEAWNTGLSR